MRSTLLFIFLTIASLCRAQENISLQELKLKGQVKLFIERQNDTTTEGGQTEYVQYHSVRLFSEDGRCTSFRDSNITYTIEDRQVKLTSVRTSKVMFEYDGNALLLRSVTKEYSANLRLNVRESAHYITHYFYDDRARDVLSFQVSVPGSDTLRFSRKIYNAQGHLGEYQMFSAADTGVNYKERYIYDEHSRLIEEDVFNDLLESFQPQSKYTYNELGQVTIEQTYDGYGELSDRSEYQYDSEGRMVTKSRYDGDVLLFEMSVEYLDIDPQGNYRKMVSSFPGEKTKDVIIRQIEYYP
jgi:YD repeat-containing protein